jgi:hypothetical protein
MHYWTDEETQYLMNFVGRYTFSEITKEFEKKFPDRHWTKRMIAGRLNRLGLCKKKPVVEAAADSPVLEVVSTVPTFVPTKAAFVVVKPDESTPNVEIVDGLRCKWPLASGEQCNHPANADGYCIEHASLVRKCVRQAVICS